MNISEKLEGKSQQEKIAIKATEIAKLDHTGTFTLGELEVEIQSLSSIEGGVEIYARVWKNGEALGFGVDGTVEIERFRIFNPPILVDDPLGDIIKEYIYEEGEEPQTRTLKEDPVEAIRQTLAHTIFLVAKSGENVVEGKVGKTTDTFYPSSDGYARFYGGNEAFSTVRGSAGTDADTATNPTNFCGLSSGNSSNTWVEMHRGIALFDTSAIPDTAVISAATFSLYGSTASGNVFVQSVLIDKPPAQAIAAGSYDIGGWAGVQQSDTSITFNSFSTSAYNDFALNATGISNISKTGTTYLGARCSADFNNSTPTWANDTGAYLKTYQSEESGTSKDPKLVVVHAPAPAASSGFFSVL